MFTLEEINLTRVPADFEDDSTLNVRIRSTDQNGLSVVKQFELSVHDIEEVPVVVNEAPYLIRSSVAVISRSLGPGDFVGWLQVLDPDQDDTHTLELIPRAPNSDNHLSVVDSQLLLTDTVASLDRSSLSIALRATDSYGESYEQVLTYSLPKTILSSSVQFPENLPIGHTVSELSISDDDGIGDVSYQLDPSSSSPFAQIKRTCLTEPRFRGSISSSLTLSAMDSSGQSIVRQFVFSVVDVNEAPSEVLISTSDIHQDASLATLLPQFLASIRMQTIHLFQSSIYDC